MTYITALALILITFIVYVKLSMDNIQKLTDKVLAKDYTEYKREARADELQRAQVEIEKSRPPVVEDKRDDDYL
ncbi:hypothetical protein RRV45_15150 [Bacillus sp. DTU_2020_1000418_1_SI_GHA_SEK_038]|uniref:hypothetical protein n=1 Tax=Bacillus sp. DTU_2020_1000418_1_SI_GHA_SEK_038 TaxID=3077585 RepID=UPI0028EB378C|nr:hypothetical protein [Bacillus sp. DTU_2020_1000418_1_SI_GHA_SEK_038]WNS74246.1 hypothetical protein RRV45_15150 [Bacillus sp. DTU_2020_1000418_1_SI_GHA_SEK_038]